MGRKIIKNFEKIRTHHQLDKPMWILLPAQIFQQLPLGLIGDLAEYGLLELPNVDDMKVWNSIDNAHEKNEEENTE